MPSDHHEIAEAIAEAATEIAGEEAKAAETPVPDLDFLSVDDVVSEEAAAPTYEPTADDVAAEFEGDEVEASNKGARPIHELRADGLIDGDVDAHLRAMSKGFTQSKQEAAAARTERDTLLEERAQWQREREALLTAVNGDRTAMLDNDFLSRLPELAGQEVTDADLYSREGLERLAEIKAAKMLQQFAEPLQQQAEAWL